MEYISYAFHLENDKIDHQLKNLEVILTILEQRIFESSELLITADDSSHLKNLEDLISAKVLETTSVSLIIPDKRSKKFTKTTLVIDSFVGDRLVYTRSSEELLIYLYQLKSHSKDHLHWIENTSKKRDLEYRYFENLSKDYSSKIIPAKTCGFSISRQAANSIDSSEFDYYDVFTALAISIYSANASSTEICHSKNHSLHYSESDILELKSKFLKTSYLDFIKADVLVLAKLVLMIFSFVTFILTFSTLIGIFMIFMTLISLYDLSSAQSERLIVLNRQSLAAANRKRISGNFIKFVINKKY